MMLTTGMALAEPLRIATYHAPLSRKGPGLLLRDILAGDDALRATLAPIVEVRPDVLILTDIDYDHDLAALGALGAMLAGAGADLPHAFALRPNTGLQTEQDLDGDGRRGGPRDAQGYGWFSGQGGMAVLSRWPVDPAGVTDLSALLWADLPGTRMTPDDPAPDLQRLSSSGHWSLRLLAPDPFTLLMFHATPPVFDGPEDRNGRRNADEIALWRRYLEGELGLPVPEGPLVLAGNANLDPAQGEGLRAEIAALLAHPGLRAVAPTGPFGLATARWPPPGPGALRVQYLMHSPDLVARDQGQVWPDTSAGAAHALIWADLMPVP